MLRAASIAPPLALPLSYATVRRVPATRAGLQCVNYVTLRQPSDDAQHRLVSLMSVVFSYHTWRRGVVVSGLRRMNEVNARPARLVLGWVTVSGRVCHLGM